ncbi:MAG: GMC family oxidoreductase [Myxococcales bacterium]|nr:GMC family oxidoreductase [Myxococcales bacterium]
MDNNYDLILVGSSFASSFFLLEYLRRFGPDRRVLVLEWGRRRSHQENIESRRHSDFDFEDIAHNPHPTKQWVSNIVFGGNSNCWWACTPRMLPSDFELNSKYGVGVDWPIGYDDLEPFYAKAEQIMSVSGPDDGSPFPRSTPYPQPPHRFSEPDRVLKQANPDTFFVMPTARARVATKNRPACCATSTCHLCPIDAKFTVQNELAWLYEDPRVELRLNAKVTHLELAAGVAKGVHYEKDGRTHRVAGDLIGLCANALMNPSILLRSGVSHPWVGGGLSEQVSNSAKIYLDNLDAFQGSTSLTGHGYMLYDGMHRRERAACLIEFSNKPVLRPEFGRWRQILPVKLIYEDLPKLEHKIDIDSGDGKPRTIFGRHSDYTQRAIDENRQLLARAVSALPVESIEYEGQVSRTEAHILGTARMGTDPSTSVVDPGLTMHSHRNVLVLGGSAFPTCAPANPTLTICALSLRAASML